MPTSRPFRDNINARHRCRLCMDAPNIPASLVQSIFWSQTRKIWSLFAKAIAIHSGWLADHCSWLTCSSAVYAKIGSSTAFGTEEGTEDRSQIRDWQSSPLCRPNKNATVLEKKRFGCWWMRKAFFAWGKGKRWCADGMEGGFPLGGLLRKIIAADSYTTAKHTKEN